MEWTDFRWGLHSNMPAMPLSTSPPQTACSISTMTPRPPLPHAKHASSMAAPSEPASAAVAAREMQLQREIAALRAQLQQQALARSPAPATRWSSRSTAEAALIDFLADTHASASDAE